MKFAQVAFSASVLASSLACAEMTPAAASISMVGGQRTAAAAQPAPQWSTWLPTPAVLAVAAAPATPGTPATPFQREPSSGRKDPAISTAIAIPMLPANPAMRAGLHR